MYETFTQERITQLRMKKDVSAREMSLSLGQNSSYINHIENKKALPSLEMLFCICDYFGITPREFFDEGNAAPRELNDIIEDLKSLDAETFGHVAALVNALKKKSP
ncbi:MAG TPA: helix-turn-helix domain-containing protein [Firmicutes bacterium]|nr:helix-turn-helix domain-containing protein [Bacillota bacterium]